MLQMLSLLSIFQLTDEKRKEMQMYKQQAIISETRMRARSRQRLLQRVQNVMNSIDVSVMLYIKKK